MVTIAAVGWGISAAGWIVSPTFTRLLDKATSYINRDESVQKLLRRLETYILPRLALTLEALESSERRSHFEQLVRELMSAFYEVEDILDDEYCRLERQISLKERKRKRKRDDVADPSNQDVSIKAIWKTMPAGLMENLKKIEKLIDDAQNIIGLAYLPTNNENGNHAPNVTAKCIPKRTTADPPAKVTGRDEDRKQIVNMLRDTEHGDNLSSSGGKCYSVVCIHGIPGSGKTTLAQYVCKYEEDARPRHFDLVMWIHVSQNFRVGNIFREMFEQATREPCPQLESLTVLQRKLKENLCGKRFLLVLDDVWYKKDVSGEELSPLEVGKAGSKIIVTSRTRDAILALGPVRSRCIPIPDLKKDKFLELFMHYALDGAEMDDHDFKEIGDEIAQKLKRSPLAARTVGGKLRIRQDVKFWRGVGDGDPLKDTMGALRWSYEHLDEQARRCFAYCSIFPRGYPLRRDKLINLWVAEGFINREEFQVVGGDCWHKLVATSFLQKGKDESVEEYYVHDLLHDLAETVAGSDCFRIESEWKRQVPQDVRHLFIKVTDVNKKKITDKIVKLEKLRTLIIDGEETEFGVDFFDRIFNSLKRLRVLSVQTQKAVEVPESIVQLMHLRYLAIGGASTITLPSTLTPLPHARARFWWLPKACKSLSRKYK